MVFFLTRNQPKFWKYLPSAATSLLQTVHQISSSQLKLQGSHTLTERTNINNPPKSRYNQKQVGNRVYRNALMKL